MSHTITVRLTEELAAWLAETARSAGVPAGRIIRGQLERARAERGTQRFMKQAEKMRGPADLSSRKRLFRTMRGIADTRFVLDRDQGRTSPFFTA